MAIFGPVFTFQNFAVSLCRVIKFLPPSLNENVVFLQIGITLRICIDIPINS